jgi:hypothetical protein
MRTLEQAGIEMLFQLLDLKGHRRLSHEQQFSGFGEGQLLGNGMKNLQSAISHFLMRG